MARMMIEEELTQTELSAAQNETNVRGEKISKADRLVMKNGIMILLALVVLFIAGYIVVKLVTALTHILLY